MLHRVRPSIIAETAALQARIFARAADWVKPGGTLVYATCSLEPSEGEAQLDAFLSARSDYSIVPVDQAELPGDAGGGAGVVAGDHDHPDAGPAGLGDGDPRFLPWGVDDADDAGEDELLLEVLAGLRRGTVGEPPESGVVEPGTAASEPPAVSHVPVKKRGSRKR